MTKSDPLADVEGFRILNMRTLATRELTNGAFESVEDLRDEGEGPAPHVHGKSDEALYVLDGAFTFLRGNEEIDARVGSLVFIP